MKNKYFHDDYSALPPENVQEIHHLVAFLLDNSLSMTGKPIQHLVRAVNNCIQQLQEDEKASLGIEIMLTSFNDGPELISDWRPISQCHPIELDVGGRTTNLTAALSYGIDKLRERGRYLAKNCVMRIPYLVLITDAEGGDVTEIAKIIHDRQNKKLMRLFVLVVPGYDKETIKTLCPDGKRLLELEGKENYEGYGQFFNWFAASLKAVSESALNENVSVSDPVTPGGNLNHVDVDSWFND